MNSRVRVMAITAIFAMAFTVVSVKLIWIQLVKQDVYREKAIRMHTNGEPVAAQRGSILDVSGRVLAQSMPLIEVRLDGKVLAERPKELPILAGLLGVSAEWLKGQADPGNRYQKIAEGLTPETEGKLLAAKISCIQLKRKTVRNYPNGTETAQVLGYVDLREQTVMGLERPISFEVGEAGVEKSMDRYLRGVAGERRITRDVHRREIPYFRLSDRPARDGYHVVLTLDQSIQHIVEREADALLEKFSPENLHIVVMRPATGEILAMVSRPSFDPNQRKTFEAEVPGYEVAGKTGTAQKISSGAYAKDKHRASFIGFLPADRPEFLVSILVDEPKGKIYYGGQVAAPAFSRIATQVAQQLNLNRGTVVARRTAL